MNLPRVLFAPVGIAAGIGAGIVARRIFGTVWGKVDDQEAPRPDDRSARWGKMLVALAVEGAIFRAVRGAVDRASRQGFRKATGIWPGDERPDPA